MALTHAEVMERRMSVSSLMVQGLSPSEIAKVLQEDVGDIYNDVREIRSGRNPELAMHSVGEVFAQVFLNARARTRRLWSEVEATDGVASRLFALRELRLQDIAMLRYASQIAKSLKVAEDAKDLTPDEEQLVASMTARFFAGRFRKSKASADELKKLKALIERLEEGEKITNPLEASETETSNPPDDGAAQPFAAEELASKSDETNATQVIKNVHHNL